MGSSVSDTGVVEQSRHAGGDDRGGVVVLVSCCSATDSRRPRSFHVVNIACRSLLTDTSEVGRASEVAACLNNAPRT